MTSAECLSAYRSGVSDSVLYMQSAFNKKADGTFQYDEKHRAFIVDAAFLKFYICWETFLESIFVSFLLGESTIIGTNVPKCIVARDEQHALKILIGTNKYFDWTNPEIVRDLSKIYLENENTIGNNVLAIQTQLFELKTIRNAAAHITSTTQTKLDSVASKLLNHQQTNSTVSELIVKNMPGTAQTIFEYYKELLDSTAESICKGSK